MTYMVVKLRRAVWLGFSSTLVMIIVMQMSLHFIPAPEDMAQKIIINNI